MPSPPFKPKPQRFEEPSYARLLTFSCFRNLPLFDHPDIPEIFLNHLHRKRLQTPFEIWAYVVMPNHVHVLLYPCAKTSIRNVLESVKNTSAKRAIAVLKEEESPQLSRMRLKLRGQWVHRFWQVGGGHDRNLWTPQRTHSAIEYIHANPIRNQLVDDIRDWKWSSVRAWEEGSREPIPINTDSFRG